MSSKNNNQNQNNQNRQNNQNNQNNPEKAEEQPEQQRAKLKQPTEKSGAAGIAAPNFHLLLILILRISTIIHSETGMGGVKFCLLKIIGFAEPCKFFLRFFCVFRLALMRRSRFDMWCRADRASAYLLI